MLISKWCRGLGSQGLYNTTNCTDNILGRFLMILQIKLQE